MAEGKGLEVEIAGENEGEKTIVVDGKEEGEERVNRKRVHITQKGYEFVLKDLNEQVR